VRLDDGSQVLSKIGCVAVRRSRTLHGAPKTVAISREPDGWYVVVSYAAAPTQPLPRTGKETGSDVGLQVVLVTADGLAVDHPRHLRTSERALKRADRRVSRRKRGRRTASAARRRCNCGRRSTRK
jgi:putative transposase